MKKLLFISLLLLTAAINGQYVGILSSSQGGSASSLLTGLEMYYKGNDASGNITDASGHNRSGSATGITYSQAGPGGSLGNSLQFNGTSGQFTVGSLPTPSSLTISLWLKTSTTSDSKVIYWTNGSNGLILYMNGSYGGYSILLMNGGVNDQEFAIDDTWNDGAFHNLILTFNGTALNCYIDNISKLSTTWAHSLIWTGVTTMAVMSEGGAGYCSGYLNGLGIWSKVISSDERTTINSKSQHPW